MQQNLFSKFNIYDQLGYLMVGGMTLIITAYDSALLGFKVPSLNLDNSVVWLIVTYATGHFIQGIANIITREKKDDFSDEQKTVLEKARNYFDIKDDDGSIWNFCYMFTIAKDITGQVQQFNAYYSLYRGWTVIFLLESVFLTFNLIANFSLTTLLFIISSGICAIIFYWRSKRFWVYLTNKVLQTFVVVTKLGI